LALDPSLMGFVDVERHGRLAIARIKADQGAQSASDVALAIRDFYDRHADAWHVIWAEQAEQYGLPDASRSEGKVIAWLIPRLFQYVTRGKGNFVHGGLSMYETIVPVATLRRGAVEAEAPVVILGGQLASAQEGALLITVLNKSNQPLQNLVVEIPELGIRGLSMRDISPGDVVRMDVPVVPARSGDLSVQIILEGEIGGMRKRFQEKRTLSVLPGRLERVRQSTRRTFEDDVDKPQR
jgi:hypothetical protein